MRLDVCHENGRSWCTSLFEWLGSVFGKWEALVMCLLTGKNCCCGNFSLARLAHYSMSQRFDGYTIDKCVSSQTVALTQHEDNPLFQKKNPNFLMFPDPDSCDFDLTIDEVSIFHS